MQELKEDSEIGRGRSAPSTTLQNSRIAVVQPTGKKPRGIALLHHSDLEVVESHADSDDEFVAALFRLPSSKKLVAVAGLHAKSKGDMQSEADRGGSRALLRHAINARRWQAEHRVVLGDFNSHYNHREIFSWHCFYALSSPHLALDHQKRRDEDHPPLHVIAPDNAQTTSTFVHPDSGSSSPQVIDFIAVDERSVPGAKSTILAEVAAKGVRNQTTNRPNVSDHLPVEGSIEI